MIQNPDYLSMYEDFLQFMLTQSKAYQKSLIAQDVIAYSGIKGAFAHMISEKIFEGNPKLAFNSFEEVIDAVVDHKVEFGVIPFENTNSGLVGEVLDLLYQKPVYIVKVADLKVDQCLLGLPEASLKDIEWVYSKDQALMQSREFLESLGVKASLIQIRLLQLNMLQESRIKPRRQSVPEKMPLYTISRCLQATLKKRPPIQHAFLSSQPVQTLRKRTI